MSKDLTTLTYNDPIEDLKNTYFNTNNVEFINDFIKAIKWGIKENQSETITFQIKKNNFSSLIQFVLPNIKWNETLEKLLKFCTENELYEKASDINGLIVELKKKKHHEKTLPSKNSNRNRRSEK